MKKLFLCWFLSTTSAFATTVSLDFSEFAAGEAQHVFEGPYYSDFVEPDFGFGGSTIIAIERLGGGSFALFDFDLQLNGAFGISVYADITGGGTVTDETALGTGDWLNVSTVYIYGQDTVGWGGSFYLENVLVGAAVPVPGAVWLFCSALMGLGWLRRKHASS